MSTMKTKPNASIRLVEVPSFKRHEYPTIEKLSDLYFDVVETMNITYQNITDLNSVFSAYSSKDFFFLLEVSKKIIEMLVELDDIAAKKIASKHEKTIYRFKNTKMEPDKQARVTNAVQALFDDTIFFFNSKKHTKASNKENDSKRGANK